MPFGKVLFVVLAFMPLSVKAVPAVVALAVMVATPFVMFTVMVPYSDWPFLYIAVIPMVCVPSERPERV